MRAELRTDPELRKLMRQLTPDELALLESSLLADGVRDALVAWRRNGERVLLDGHHRYEIARRHGLEFGVEEIELPDLAAAKRWVIRNQLGRRNLRPAEVSYCRGLEYLAEKKAAPNPEGNNQ
jgi:ParB-like chromosome segregation protein Spo0J